jgi:transposase
VANRLADVAFPPKANPANVRLAEHRWRHLDEWFTFLRVPGVGATNWRAELAIRFGVIYRQVWGGNRTWAGARAQTVLMSVWRTCWQQGREAIIFVRKGVGTIRFGSEQDISALVEGAGR